MRPAISMLWSKADPWPAVTTLAAFSVYFLTLAPDLTFANYGRDGGELITAAATLGIPHPPGYPSYVLLGKLFSLLPIGSIAFRFNLFSAVAMALAAGFVTAVTRHEMSRCRQKNGETGLARADVPLAAGLTFAFMPLVWSQALIAEVYALNALFLAAFLWALLTGRPPILVGILLGLSLTGHLTSYLMVPLVLLLLPPATWPAVALGAAAGLAPLLALPLLAQSDSPLNWGEPTTLARWWWLVSGRLYHGNAGALPLAELGERLAHWASGLATQLSWLGILLLPLTIFRQWQERQVAPVALWLVLFLYGLLALTYNTPDAAVFFLPGLLLLTVLLIPALRRLGVAALLLPLLTVALNFDHQNLRNQPPLRLEAEDLLAAVPPAAIVLTPGEPTIFALLYYHYVERQRDDIILVDDHLLAFEWYRRTLGRRYPELAGLDVDDVARFERLNARERWFCRVSLEAGRRPDCFKDLN
jgi:hypothetical protein